jgi:Right handed beta helix region/Secretion system C-terminal sorting domain
MLVKIIKQIVNQIIMKKLLKIINETLLVIFLSPIMQLSYVSAQTEIPAGNISGSWILANSPYQINGEVTIPSGETLTIEPGVKVIFMGYYKFNVQGRLLAIGTKEDTITFTARDSTKGWHGIRFLSTPKANDSSKIIYCKLQYGKANSGSYYDQSGGALFVMNFSKLLISHCLINSNLNNGDPDYTGGGAICIWNASPVLTNCTISNNDGNTGGAIICWSNANPVISNNIFAYNSALDGAAIYIGNASNPIIKNNIIIHNHASDNCGGIRSYQNSNPLIINNVIANNHATYGGAVDCRDHSNPIVINSIIYGNSAGTGKQVFIDGADSDPSFLYCDIEGGKEEFKGTGAGTNYNGTYSNNIDSDPLFADTTHGDFHLSDTSPCISTGIDSVTIGNKWYYMPPSDFEGNPRPNPAGSLPDMGALENSNGQSPITGMPETEELHASKVQLFQNFPNPCSSNTTIAYAVLSNQLVTLKVYDIQGREIAMLADEVKQPGGYIVTFNTKDLPNGIYFYQMVAGSALQTRKFLVVR